MSQIHYDFSIPLFIKTLGGLKNVLEVAEVVAGKKEGGEKEVLEARLAPDMFPLIKQIQVSCDQAKGLATRLTGKDALVLPDTETTIAELKSRIDKTIAYLETFTPADFEGAETCEVSLPYFPEHHFMGDVYLKEYVLPNFYFHVSMTYAIVRMLGGELGKKEFINGLTLIKNV